jgi:hypothetical protein
LGRGTVGFIKMTGRGAVGLGISHLAGLFRAKFDHRIIDEQLRNMEPEIEQAVNQELLKANDLLQRAEIGQSIYANINLVTSQETMIEPETHMHILALPWVTLESVGISMNDIKGTGIPKNKWGIDGYTTYRPSTYSMPIFDVILQPDTPPDFKDFLDSHASQLLRIWRYTSENGPAFYEVNKQILLALTMLGKPIVSTTLEADWSKWAVKSDVERFFALKTAIAQALRTMPAKERESLDSLQSILDQLNELYEVWPSQLEEPGSWHRFLMTIRE